MASFASNKLLKFKGTQNYTLWAVRAKAYFTLTEV